MTYTQEGDEVTLKMTRGDYQRLLLLVGRGLGTMLLEASDRRAFYRCLAFVNEMNNGNDEFTPYEIPEGFR